MVRPHGKKGEVAVEAVRGLPLALRQGLEVALTPPAFDRDRFCTVEAISERGREALVRFSGIDTMSCAEGIVGCYVLARADDLDLAPLAASVDELRGRAVVDARYGALGTVADILEKPANDVWVVDGGAYGEVLIPVIDQVVELLPESGAIRVHVMDGLIDVEPPAAAELADTRGATREADAC